MASTRKIILKSSDGEAFEVDEALALESQTIKKMIEVGACASSGISIPNVTSKILAKVIEYWKKQVDDLSFEEWVDDFVKIDRATLFDLILAAKYLDIKSLFDLTSETMVDMIEGKTPEEIRTNIDIKIDFTPEEEEEFERKNQWAFK